MAAVDPKPETEKLMELVSLLEKNRRWYHKGAGILAAILWIAWTVALFLVLLGQVEANGVSGIILGVLSLVAIFSSAIAGMEVKKK